MGWIGALGGWWARFLAVVFSTCNLQCLTTRNVPLLPGTDLTSPPAVVVFTQQPPFPPSLDPPGCQTTCRRSRLQRYLGIPWWSPRRSNPGWCLHSRHLGGPGSRMEVQAAGLSFKGALNGVTVTVASCPRPLSPPSKVRSIFTSWRFLGWKWSDKFWEEFGTFAKHLHSSNRLP